MSPYNVNVFSNETFSLMWCPHCRLRGGDCCHS